MPKCLALEKLHWGLFEQYVSRKCHNPYLEKLISFYRWYLTLHTVRSPANKICWYALPPHSAELGKWNDEDDSGSPDAGEVVSYVAVVKNEGTVTLDKLNVVDVRAGMICEEPASGLLGQGEEYECRGSAQVRKQTFGPPY